MRLGVVILPEHPWAEGAGIWTRAEELGFSHAWTYDHLAWRSLRDATWFGTMPTLTAAALATSTMRLGTLVASPNVREPVGLARDALAIDDISAGRLTLGIGAGGTGWDATMRGQTDMTPRARADRFEEFVDLTDRLLRDPPVSYHGVHYTAVDVPMVPGCVQRPRVPFAIAATGARGYTLAARFGQTWVTNGERDYDAAVDAVEGAVVVARQSERLATACDSVGRDPTTIGRLVLLGFHLRPALHSAEALRDEIGRYEDVGVTDLVLHWPRPDRPFAGDRDQFEQVIAEVTAR